MWMKRGFLAQIFFTKLWKIENFSHPSCRTWLQTQHLFIRSPPYHDTLTHHHFSTHTIARGGSNKEGDIPVSQIKAQSPTRWTFYVIGWKHASVCLFDEIIRRLKFCRTRLTLVSQLTTTELTHLRIATCNSSWGQLFCFNAPFPRRARMMLDFWYWLALMAVLEVTWAEFCAFTLCWCWKLN